MGRTYGIFTYIWLKQMEHVGKYSQSHGAWFPNEDSFGGCLEPCQETKQRVIFYWKCNIPGAWNSGRGKLSVYHDDDGGDDDICKLVSYYHVTSNSEFD